MRETHLGAAVEDARVRRVPLRSSSTLELRPLVIVLRIEVVGEEAVGNHAKAAARAVHSERLDWVVHLELVREQLRGQKVDGATQDADEERRE